MRVCVLVSECVCVCYSYMYIQFQHQTLLIGQEVNTCRIICKTYILYSTIHICQSFTKSLQTERKDNKGLCNIRATLCLLSFLSNDIFCSSIKMKAIYSFFLHLFTLLNIFFYTFPWRPPSPHPTVVGMRQDSSTHPKLFQPKGKFCQGQETKESVVDPDKPRTQQCF